MPALAPPQRTCLTCLIGDRDSLQACLRQQIRHNRSECAQGPLQCLASKTTNSADVCGSRGCAQGIREAQERQLG